MRYKHNACAHCGQAFSTNVRTARYCSPSCYHSARWGKPTASRARTGDQKYTCKQCGEHFVDWTAPQRQFCSNTCRTLASRRAIISTCEECGAAFHHPPSVRRRWCSRACYLLGRALSESERETLFWSWVDWSNPEGCWPWTGAVTGGGYGYFGKPKTTAHKLAWQFSRRRAIPTGLVVMHLCDNRRCCRPDHLHADTESRNQRYRKLKDTTLNHADRLPC
jgi:hypothetical protein